MYPSSSPALRGAGRAGCEGRAERRGFFAGATALGALVVAATTGHAIADMALADNAETGMPDLFAPDGGPPYTPRPANLTLDSRGNTDNGMVFGIAVDLEESGGLNTIAAPRESSETKGAVGPAGMSLFISGKLGTITMGDTERASDWALADLDEIGPPDSGDDAEASRAPEHPQSNDYLHERQVLRYDHTVGNLGLSASTQLNGNTAFDHVNGAPALSFGSKYRAGLGRGKLDLGFGFMGVHGNLNHPRSRGLPFKIDIVGASAAYGESSNFAIGVQYGITESQFIHDLLGDIGPDESYLGLGVGYFALSPWAFRANYGRARDDKRDNVLESLRLGVKRPLGEGTSVLLDYSGSTRNPTENIGDFHRYSLVFVMSF